jgi:hypothetical protein
MHTDRRLVLLLFVFSFVVLALPAFGQQVIATVPVGTEPDSAAVNRGPDRKGSVHIPDGSNQRSHR